MKRSWIILSVLTFFLISGVSFAAGEPLKIGVTQGDAVVVLAQSGFDLWVEDTLAGSLPDQRVVIRASGNKLVLTGNAGAQIALPGDDWVLLSSGQGLESSRVVIDGTSYRGGATASLYAGAVEGINRVTMDQYLYGVLPKEMSPQWPLEALKAQAVAARNFAESSRSKHAERGYDLCDTTDCQVYGGMDVEAPATTRAVDETSDLFLYYGEDLVQCYYHANSGGHTASVENVWSRGAAYLVGKPDPYSVGTPSERWSATYTRGEIEAVLEGAGYRIGSLLSVQVEEVARDFRVQRITFTGDRDSVTLEKEAVRRLFGYTTFKSIWYDVDAGGSLYVRDAMTSRAGETRGLVVRSSEGETLLSGSLYAATRGGIRSVETTGDEITFAGQGYGHGIGMSQWGARTMAEEGMTFEEILTFYYTDTEVR